MMRLNPQMAQHLQTLVAISSPSSTSKAALPTLSQIPIRLQSTRSTGPAKKETSPEDTNYKHPQSFVKTRFKPGEYDPMSTTPRSHGDPLYRPPWKNRAKIISAEDFAARPRVTFNEEYASLSDGMVVLSWLTEKERQLMYDFYCQLMVEQSNANEGVTSHEYVMRVVAQKFNVTPARAGAIVEQIHDEQIAIRNGEKVDFKLQELVDAKIREHIRNAYNAYGEEDPMEYVEDPVGVNPAVNIGGKGEIRVEDLYKVDEMVERAEVREKDEAQLAIDGMLYIEDKDDDKVESKVNAECMKLLKQNEGFKALRAKYREHSTSIPVGNGRTGTNGESKRRKRWKYVARTISEEDEKKNRGKDRPRGVRAKKRHAMAEAKNSLVEVDGELRVATVKEVESTSWKSERHITEFIYKGVKEAWLDRQLKGVKDGWGRAPPHLVEEMEAKAREEEEKEKLKESGSDDAESEGDDGRETDASGVDDSDADDQDKKD